MSDGTTREANPARDADRAIETPAEAIHAMLARLQPVPTERLNLDAALGRVCSEAIATDRPSPPADVSAMDGYAVRLADAGRAVEGRLPVAGTILAGQAAPPLPAGEAMRIMTGAVVPPEAEAVVRREDTQEAADHVVLNDPAAVQPGQHIRRRGENLAAQTQVIKAGAGINAGTAAALASFGYPEVSVHRQVRLGLLVTGDELLDADAVAEDWQIRDSNGPALQAMFGGLPWVACTPRRRVADEREALRQAVADALAEHDALLLTGGVSMGTHDFVPEILREAGCEVVFHRLAQKPGRPLLGAIGPGGQLVLGLPGNPMSVMVTARVFAVPLLRKLGGWSRPVEPRPAVRVQEDDGKTIGLWWHRPVQLMEDGVAAIVETKGSGDIVSIARSDGFIQIPPGASAAGPWPFYRWEVGA